LGAFVWGGGARVAAVPGGGGGGGGGGWGGGAVEAAVEELAARLGAAERARGAAEESDGRETPTPDPQPALTRRGARPREWVVQRALGSE